MNESTPPPLPQPTAANLLPPLIPSGARGRPVADVPLGANAEERSPITGWAATVDALLRQPRRVLYQLQQPGSGPLVRTLLAITIVCALVYGEIIGLFSGGTQLWAAPLKVVTGLLLTAVICLPSLHLFACLSGSDGRLVEFAGRLAGLLALTTLILGGFAPVAWVFSQSTASPAAMGALHLGFWGVATAFGLRFLRTAFGGPSGGRRVALGVWSAVFILVALQMTTALRPFLGTSPTLLPAAKEKQFFLGHWFQCLEGEQKQ